MFRIVPIETKAGATVEEWPSIEDALSRAGELCQQRRHRATPLVVIDDEGTPIGAKRHERSTWSDMATYAAMRRMRRDAQYARCGGRLDDNEAA